MLIDKGIEGICIACIELGVHKIVFCESRIGEGMLVIFWQGVPNFFVYADTECRGGFVEAGPVVVFGDFVETESEVIVGSDPFSGVDGTGLQGGEDFASGQANGGSSDTVEDFSSEAWYSHFEAFHIVDGIDFFIEPSAHLHAGISAWEVFDSEF